jgi:hypothetical protein
MTCAGEPGSWCRRRRRERRADCWERERRAHCCGIRSLIALCRSVSGGARARRVRRTAREPSSLELKHVAALTKPLCSRARRARRTACSSNETCVLAKQVLQEELRRADPAHTAHILHLLQSAICHVVPEVLAGLSTMQVLYILYIGPIHLSSYSSCWTLHHAGPIYLSS